MIKLDDRAIAAGTAVGVAVGLGLHYTIGQLAGAGALPIAMFVVVINAASLLGKAIAGFVAGFIARRDGAVHGAIVGALTAALGIAIGVALTVSRGQGHVYLDGGIVMWATMAFWALVGVGVAALCGLLAEKLRA